MSSRELAFAAAGAGGDATYVEDVFSTYLYTGNGSTQTITNGIDLAGEGGMVWVKNRTAAANNYLWDSARGTTKALYSNTTNQNQDFGEPGTPFLSNGFGVSPMNNDAASPFASWTFRKAPKFFDVVTYTGTGVAQAINHSLGSTPGMVIVKSTDLASQWYVYHKGLNGGVTPEQYYIFLSLTNEQASNSVIWNDTAPTSTQFTVGTAAGLNNSGSTYVAYLFAHNAGGFGASGTDNVISCGSFTTDGSGNASVNLGYEPQYLLMKSSSLAGTGWAIVDNMRGASVTSSSYLQAQASSAEDVATPAVWIPNATGFTIAGWNTSSTFIYMAIRRPMKPPTSGTEVFQPYLVANNTSVQPNFPVDAYFSADPNNSVLQNTSVGDRLRGTLPVSITTGISAENTTYVNSASLPFSGNTGSFITNITAFSTNNVIDYLFKRAPTFFDVVCYTGTGANTTQTHNLGVVPEMMIVKRRNGSGGWSIYTQTLGPTYIASFSTGVPLLGPTVWNNTSPTASVFTIGTSINTNSSGATYVAYLFATVAGVSKVGGYTGTGANQTINCGFTGGARLVIIKRTDATANWWVWDTARGMVAGTDPRRALNASAAQINSDWVYTTTTGFEIVTTDATVNASGGSYIFLAIA